MDEGINGEFLLDWMSTIRLAGIILLVGASICGITAQPRVATATATVANGSLVAIAVTDGGAGYVNPPAVTITGGGGSGTTAQAVLNPSFAQGAFYIVK